MRHHRLQPLAWLVPLSLAFGVASCDVSTSPGSYYVTYRATTTQTFKNHAGLDSVVTYATLDSVTYSNGTTKCTTTCTGDSTLVKVTSPAANYSTELTIPNGQLVEGHLYGTGVVTGTVKFAAVWMTATGIMTGDSSTASTTAGAKFQLNIARRAL